MHRAWTRAAGVIAALMLIPLVAMNTSGAQAAPDRHGCGLPAAGGTYSPARPQDHQLDPARIRAAIDYATSHGRLSVQIFRDNCLVAESPLNGASRDIPWPVWSSTKSVIALLTGIAVDQGKLSLDDPIGKYLPAGWGSKAHRTITVDHLLTQTSGLQQAILSEALSFPADPDVAQQTLALPLTHRPGTHWVYGQRPVDLLAFVVRRAVGQDLQAYAQKHLFGPIGIPADSYLWLRDRSGQNYGYAHLFLPPHQYAKLGLLLGNQGTWRGRRVLSPTYVQALAEPTPANPCYGRLFWTNKGDRCTSATFPDSTTVDHRAITSAPRDLFAMVGFLHQNNFVIPSLNMVITWTGVLGDTYPNLNALASAAPADLYHEFFRILMSGVRDVDVPDPGRFVGPGIDFDLDVPKFLDPGMLGLMYAPNSRCNVLACDSGPGPR